MGLPVVLQLQQQLEEEQQQRRILQNPVISGGTDNPYLALEWLAQSYVASSEVYIRLGDSDAARRDAWSACLLTSYTKSSNNNKAALQCMLYICQSTNDDSGELSTSNMLRSAV